MRKKITAFFLNAALFLLVFETGFLFAQTASAQACSNFSCPTGRYCNSLCQCVTGFGPDSCGVGGNNTGGYNLPPVPEPSVTSFLDFYVALKAIAQWILVFGLIIGVLFVIYGGVLIVTSTGDDRKLESGKQTITWAIVGVILLVLAYAIVNLISSFFGASGPVITP